MIFKPQIVFYNTNPEIYPNESAPFLFHFPHNVINDRKASEVFVERGVFRIRSSPKIIEREEAK